MSAWDQRAQLSPEHMYTIPKYEHTQPHPNLVLPQVDFQTFVAQMRKTKKFPTIQTELEVQWTTS